MHNHDCGKLFKKPQHVNNLSSNNKAIIIQIINVYLIHRVRDNIRDLKKKNGKHLINVANYPFQEKLQIICRSDSTICFYITHRTRSVHMCV